MYLWSRRHRAATVGFFGRKGGRSRAARGSKQTRTGRGIEPLEARLFFATTVLFTEGFEGSTLQYPWFNRNFPGGNPDTRWGVNTRKAAAGDQSAFCASLPGGQGHLRNTYTSDQQNALTRDNVSLAGYLSAKLTFKYFLNTEPGYDLFT